VEREGIFDGLNQEQRRAVGAVRGPVRILAGAGTGKTTTITRRIANQVATETLEPSSILAVTFTDRAAGEMRARLEALDVRGVRARTFHSAAAAQLRYLASEHPGRILPTKVIALRQIASGLPPPYRFRPAADLATEIEWAKNRRIAPAHYVDALGKHEPPIPPELMSAVWRRYEDGKRRRGLVDFEDLLELAISLFEQDPYAVERFREHYRAFTVDEYQDVNLLQQSLLECWLGERDDLCVVGDDHQSIYSFTGASATYLLDMPRRYARTLTVTLESNYRSTPQVLAVANDLGRTLGGAHKTLRATASPGPASVFEETSSLDDELQFVVSRIRALHERHGVAYEDMAILYRTNYRSEDYEEALSAARIPFGVRDGAFLERPAARRMLAMLRRLGDEVDVATAARRAAERDGWIEPVPDGLGEREVTRQRDLGRLVQLATELDDGSRSAVEVAGGIEARFAPGGGGHGVALLTLHRAKGLEFEAVFIPHVQEGELPFRRSTDDASVEEERRLFYVGITRAKRHLVVTWTAGRRATPSRFLDAVRPRRRAAETARSPDQSLLRALRAWRSERAKRDGVPAFVILHDRTIEEIAILQPRSAKELAGVAGIGPAKLERYARDILATVATASAARPSADHPRRGHADSSLRAPERR
jgi:DNA helicase II / ATP-dependent DNA helicase PcrA